MKELCDIARNRYKNLKSKKGGNPYEREGRKGEYGRQRWDEQA